ncbi:MAG: serine/threonine protein kinase [Proteobacteria bacterium]|nr:serine/threonine protein kinase [Pseudomonadota bacterium]
MSSFEDLLERLVPGTAHRGLTDAECPPFPTELGLEPASILGRGSMGRVFKARDPLLERIVAVKVSRPDVGEPARKALLHEARVTSHLAHPAVLPVRQVGDLVCIVFRIAPRLTLHRLMTQHKHLMAAEPIEKRLTLLKEGAEAIVHAHRLGIVHGDVPPGNIAIDNAGEPYILDWGGLQHVPGSFSGHPMYASPEELAGGSATAESDVYTIGAVDWEALSMRSFREQRQGESLGDAIVRFRDEYRTPEPLGLDPALDEVFTACLQTDPAQRPTSAEYVAKTPSHASEAQKQPLWSTEARVRGLIVDQEVTWVRAAPTVERSPGAPGSTPSSRTCGSATPAPRRRGPWDSIRSTPRPMGSAIWPGSSASGPARCTTRTSSSCAAARGRTTRTTCGRHLAPVERPRPGHARSACA